MIKIVKKDLGFIIYQQKYSYILYSLGTEYIK